MPFPNPRVLTSFLREYLYYRQTNTWNTTTAMITSYYRDDAQIKTSQCFEVNRHFYNTERLKSLNGWVELAFILGEQGRQGSRFAETLQAIRSYIIDCLRESEYNEALQNTIDELNHKATELDAQVLVAMEAKEAPKQTSRLEQKYHETLLKLADLGDHTAVFKAERLGLFKELEHPNLGDRNLPMFNDVNGNIPFAYHDKACLFYYYRFIKPLTKWQVSFEDFVKASCELSPDIEEPIQVAVDSNRAGLKSTLGGIVASLFGGSGSQEKTPVTQGPSVTITNPQPQPNIPVVQMQANQSVQEQPLVPVADGHIEGEEVRQSFGLSSSH